jgi:hypothetical protein
MIGDAMVARSALHILTDGAGGAFVWWMEGASFYIKRIGSDGATIEGWPARGQLVVTLSDANRRPDVIGDGAHGVYAAWPGNAPHPSDPRAAFVIHLGPNNESTGGYGVSRIVSAPDPVPTFDESPQLALAVDGGAYVGWARVSFDSQAFPSSWRLLRLTRSALPAPGWPLGGIEVRPLQYYDTVMRWARLDMHPDGQGGLYYFLADQVSQGTFDLDARVYRLLEDGGIASGWPASGAPVVNAYCLTDVGPDGGIRVFPGTDGGAVVGAPKFSVHWADYTGATVTPGGGYFAHGLGTHVPGTEAVASGFGSMYTATVKRSGPYGPYESGAFIKLTQVPCPAGWSGVNEYHFEPVLTWFGDVALAPTGDGGVIFIWSQRREIFGLFAKRFGAAGEVVGVDPIPARIGLERAWFAPGSGIRVIGSAGDASAVRLQVFDVAGRRLVSRELVGRGPFDTVIEGTNALPSGIYLVRFAGEDHGATLRVAVVR